MNYRQKNFCDEYLKSGNATRAYMAAYGIKNVSSAYAAAARLMKNKAVREYINARMEEVKKENIADVQEVMEYLTKVLRGESASEVVVVEGLGEGVSKAVRVEKAPDEKERLKAAELLGRRYGLFVNKNENTENINITFEGEGELE